MRFKTLCAGCATGGTAWTGRRDLKDAYPFMRQGSVANPGRSDVVAGPGSIFAARLAAIDLAARFAGICGGKASHEPNVVRGHLRRKVHLLKR